MTYLERIMWGETHDRAVALRGAFGFLFVTALFLLPVSLRQVAMLVELPDAFRWLPCIFFCCMMPVAVCLACVTLLGSFVLCFSAVGKSGNGIDLYVSAGCGIVSAALIILRIYLRESLLADDDSIVFPSIAAVFLGVMCWWLLTSFVQRQAGNFGIRTFSRIWFGSAILSGLVVLIWGTLCFSDRRAPRPAEEDALFEMSINGLRAVALLFPPFSAVYFYVARDLIADAVSRSEYPLSWLPPSAALSEPSDQFMASDDRRSQ